MVSRFLSVVRKEQRDRLEWLRVWGDECVFMEENPDQIRHNADKLYLNVKKNDGVHDGGNKRNVHAY